MFHINGKPLPAELSLEIFSHIKAPFAALLEKPIDIMQDRGPPDEGPRHIYVDKNKVRTTKAAYDQVAKDLFALSQVNRFAYFEVRDLLNQVKTNGENIPLEHQVGNINVMIGKSYG